MAAPLLGPISCTLTQPLSLSHFCQSSFAVFYRTALGIAHTSPCYSTGLLYVGRIAGGYPKPWASLAAVKAFLKLSSFLTDKLFCMEMWGGGVGGGGLVEMPRELAAKHHVAVFTH